MVWLGWTEQARAVDPVTATCGVAIVNMAVNPVTGLVQDTAKLPGVALPVLRLPLGILKTVGGILLPGVPATTGMADIKAGLAAPFNTVGHLLSMPFNFLRRL